MKIRREESRASAIEFTSNIELNYSVRVMVNTNDLQRTLSFLEIMPTCVDVINVLMNGDVRVINDTVVSLVHYCLAMLHTILVRNDVLGNYILSLPEYYINGINFTWSCTLLGALPKVAKDIIIAKGPISHLQCNICKVNLSETYTYSYLHVCKKCASI